MPSPRPIDLLRDAIEAARAALRDLDPEEVPSRVRRVRASSAGTLPPPLARSLIRELGADEFLREQALEAWDGDRPPDGGPALASYAFLAREPGWEGDLLTEAVRLGERHGIAADKSDEVAREALTAEVASLKEQLRRSREEAAAMERDLKAALEAARAPGRADRQGEERARQRLEDERSKWETRVGELRAVIEGLEAEVRERKEEAREARAERAEMSARLEASGPAVLPTDPVDLARALDHLVSHSTAMAPAPAGEARTGTPAEADVVVGSFDVSVRPDRSEAIDWLIGVDAGTVLVDGYNLGFALAGLDVERARSVAVEAASRLAIAAPGATVIVVFDSSLDPLEAGAPLPGRSGAATVVFTNGETADDAIVTRVCDATDVVVITNDRELRTRSEACGAITLWSDALVEWSRRR